MWNRLVNRFFEQGGDRKWIEEGLMAAPKQMQLMADLSQHLAYCPELLVMDERFFERFSSLSKQYVSEGIHLLCYYQSLACYAQTLGLKTEEPVESDLINVKGLRMASRVSVENGTCCFNEVYRRENSKEIAEVLTGEKMLKGFLVHNDSEEEEDFSGKHRERVINSLVSPISPDNSHPSW